MSKLTVDPKEKSKCQITESSKTRLGGNRSESTAYYGTNKKGKNELKIELKIVLKECTKKWTKKMNKTDEQKPDGVNDFNSDGCATSCNPNSKLIALFFSFKDKFTAKCFTHACLVSVQVFANRQRR